MKKVTMKDIAKASEVSVATVSYVLNHNEKETIPEETRTRILNIAHELNYVPSLTARSLAKNKSGIIGIILVSELKELLPWKKTYYMELILEIEKLLQKLDYHVLVTQIYNEESNLDIILQRSLDGAFILDVTEDYLYKVSSRLTVPIVLIDSYIEDTLFHKVIPNFEKAIVKAKIKLKEEHPFLVIDSFSNKSLVNKIKATCEANFMEFYEMESILGLKEFLSKQKNKKGIILNEALAIFAQDYFNSSDLAVICSTGNSYLLKEGNEKIIFSNRRKAEVAVDILMKYINKLYFQDKYTFVEAELE